MKKDFKPFKIGTVFNPLSENHYNIKPYLKKVEILYPSRLNAMALDPGKIAKNENLKYSPGEIIFKVKIYKKVKAETIANNTEIIISERSKRKPLIRHSALLMKKALNIKNGIYIDVDNQKEIRHAGLGSSSGLISSVACAINELFNNPIKRDALVRYLAQNHGEELDNNNNYLSPVQCIGGSAAAGLYDGAMLVLAGENKIIARMKINNRYKAVIGIPNDFEELDAHTLLKKEIKVFKNFIKTGKKFSPIIAYRLVHNILPVIDNGDLREIGNLIYEYRFKMGSIRNCSYAYNKLVDLAKKLEFLKEKNIAEVLSISSVGPAFFAITKNAGICKKVFSKNDLRTCVAELENDKYKVLKRIKQ